jgi:hypothetical protein
MTTAVVVTSIGARVLWIRPWATSRTMCRY